METSICQIGRDAVPRSGKGKVATCEFTTPVQVLFNTSKVFEGINIKKEVENDLLSSLAPQVVKSCNLFLSFKWLKHHNL